MKKEILIIDDDPIYTLIASKIIKNVDPTLIINTCENGEIGLTILEQLKGTDHNIIVLLDINMPTLDGWGFLDEIKKSNFFNLPKVEIYLISSSTDASDILKSQSYEYLKGFLSKPVNKDEINKIINAV